MNAGFRSGLVSPVFAARDCKVKRRTSAELGFHPDAAAGAFDDPLAYGEAHTSAGIGGGAAKTLEISKTCSLY